MKRFHRKSRFSNGAVKRNTIQERRRRHMRAFRKKKHAELKEALKERHKVVKITWQLHYLMIEYVTGKPVEIYGNLCDALQILGSRLFYRPTFCTIVNLYYFYKLKEDSPWPILVFEDKMEEALGEMEKEKVKSLIAYLQSNRMVHDVRDLLQ